MVGDGSFKGMGVDFADLNGDARFDFYVPNINVAWGLQESNLLFINKAANDADMRQQLSKGVAPFTQEAQQHGLAWTGWCWDVKTGDFRNDGEQDVIQTTGFIKGTENRWNWLQEAATENDVLLSNPAMWPNFQPGDDVSGHEALAFYAKNSSGTYVNISSELGLAVPTPTRAVATGDTTGTGTLDFAVARQWGPPAVLRQPGAGARQLARAQALPSVYRSGQGRARASRPSARPRTAPRSRSRRRRAPRSPSSTAAAATSVSAASMSTSGSVRTAAPCPSTSSGVTSTEASTSRR